MDPSRPLDTRALPGLALLSAGMLTFEISLSRVFAIQQFHHFAFMIVSLSLLGVAASGLMLALRPRHPPLATLAVLFSIASLASYAIINFLPFDSYSIAWDRRQIWILVLYFAAAGSPFLFAGWAAGACLADAGEGAHIPYAAVFIGSAFGCPAALGAHALLGVEGAIGLACALGLTSAAVFAKKRWKQGAFLLVGAGMLAISVSVPAAVQVQLSPYKPLAVSRLLPDASVTTTRWSASRRLDLIESGTFHLYPGLSLNAALEVPNQAGLFLDGDGPVPVNAFSADSLTASRLAESMPANLAYRLRPGAKALSLDAGAGLPALLALASGVESVTFPADEPLIIEILSGPYRAFTHDFLHDPRLIVAERAGRGVLRSGEGAYDIVEYGLSDPFRPVTSGAFSLTENYTLTREGLSDAYDRLGEDGLIVITRWLGTPPSEAARAWALLVETLREGGASDLEGRLIAYRGLRTATMLAGRRDFSQEELRLTREFLERNAFDPVFLPNLRADELNRYNRLPEPIYHQIFTALLADPESTYRSYDFNLRPPSDDRPYFFHFFRWRQTPEVLASLGLTWQPFGGSGYFVLLALLALMVSLSALLAVAPWLITRRRIELNVEARRTSIYFAALGAGYLLVEVPLIQRLTLLLDHPAIALALVLFTLLLASGVGSLLSTRVPLSRALLLLAGVLLALEGVLPTIVRQALPLHLYARLAVSSLVLILPGLLMGVPFAAGLRRLERRTPGLIPWAWAINGAASGVSGVLAALIALDLGFRAVLLVAAAAYLAAWASQPKEADGR